MKPMLKTKTTTTVTPPLPTKEPVPPRKPVLKEPRLLAAAKAVRGVPPQLPLAVDSGAFSFYMKIAAARTPEGKLIRGFQHADASYAEKKGFHNYLEKYMDFVHRYGELFQYCVSLDVIGDERRSFETFSTMHKAGLKVMPVYHFGEDVQYLKRYMEMTDYIGLGGLVKTGTAYSSAHFRDRTWKVILDSKGRPRVKVHAFGMTSFEPMLLHPYYSVDSTTAFQWSRYGCIMLPVRDRTGKKFDYATTPVIYPITAGRSRARSHIGHAHPEGKVRALVEEYVSLLGLPLETLRESYGARDTANLFFFNRMMHQLSTMHSERVEAPLTMTYYGSGNFSTTLAEFNKSLHHLQRRDELKYLAYLGTFFQLNPLQRLLKDWQQVTIPSYQLKESY